MTDPWPTGRLGCKGPALSGKHSPFWWQTALPAVSTGSRRERGHELCEELCPGTARRSGWRVRSPATQYSGVRLLNKLHVLLQLWELVSTSWTQCKWQTKLLNFCQAFLDDSQWNAFIHFSVNTSYFSGCKCWKHPLVHAQLIAFLIFISIPGQTGGCDFPLVSLPLTGLRKDRFWVLNCWELIQW